jgi:hypothetical protein
MSVYYRYLGVHRNRDGVEGPFEFTSGELLSPEEAIAQARGRLDGCEGLGGSGVVIVEGSLKRFKITEEEIK